MDRAYFFLHAIHVLLMSVSYILFSCIFNFIFLSSLLLLLLCFVQSAQYQSIQAKERGRKNAFILVYLMNSTAPVIQIM